MDSQMVRLRDLNDGDCFHVQGQDWMKAVPPIERDGERWHAIRIDIDDVGFPVAKGDDPGTGDTMVTPIPKPTQGA